jgi:wobble nucleotide-excising tRNase
MTSINTSRADLEARRAQYVILLDKAMVAYEDALTTSSLQEYTFNSGDGSQRALRRKPEEIRKEIEALEAAIAQIDKKLNGTGIIHVQLRR